MSSYTHTHTHTRAYFVSQLDSSVLHRLLHVSVRNEPIPPRLNARAATNRFGEAHKESIRLLLVVRDQLDWPIELATVFNGDLVLSTTDLKSQGKTNS